MLDDLKDEDKLEHINALIVAENVEGFVAYYNERYIIVDPFTTDYTEDEDCPEFKSNMMLEGIWFDDETLLVYHAANI